jgi:hypothetical protein
MADVAPGYTDRDPVYHITGSALARLTPTELTKFDATSSDAWSVTAPLAEMWTSLLGVRWVEANGLKMTGHFPGWRAT